MPTYEYKCPQGHEFEKFFSRISESTSELECPECGQMAERRISGGGGLLFKGSGFYLTDYGRNAHRKTAPEKKDSGDSKPSSGETKGGESGSGGGGGMKAGEAGTASGGGGTEKSPGKSSGGDKASSGGNGSTGSTKE
jgi:putative FmdB family regulatory protein